jgi:hypothetical protein
MLKFHLEHHVIEEVTALLAGDAKLTQWFVAEMKERAESELAVALADQALVSADNFKATHRPIDGVGQCTMRMAKTMHDWIIKWVGPEYVYDEAFLAQLIRDNPHLCLKPAYLKRASIIVSKPWEKTKAA